MISLIRTWHDSFRDRETAPEAMDDPNGSEDRLVRTLRQFEVLNVWISRYRPILRRFVLRDMARDPQRRYRLADFGAGGGDIAAWLLREARRGGFDLEVTAIDADPRAVRYARARWGDTGGLTVREGGLEVLEAEGPFDFVFANHVLHHLPDAGIPGVLQAFHRAATRRWVVSDLMRSPWAWLGFQTVAWGFRGSFTREDGLRSIRRGFRPLDLRARIDEADLSGRVRVLRRAPGRVVLVGGGARGAVGTAAPSV